MCKQNKLMMFSVMLCLGASESAFADTLKLYNAGQMRGTIVDMTDPGGLHFRADYGQLMFVPWDHVSVLQDVNGEFIEPKPQVASIVKDDSPVLSEREMLAKKPKAIPVQKTAVTAKIDPAPETEAENQKGLFGAEWSGQIDLGGELESGNSETQAFAADYFVEANWADIHRASARLDVDFQDEEGETVEDEQELQLRYDYFYTKKWFLANAAEFERDDIQELDLRYSLGVGLGYQPYRGKDLDLKMVLRPTYFAEEFADGSSDNGTAVEWDFDYKQKIFDKKYSVFHLHDVLVPTSETDGFLFESETGFRAPIYAGIFGSTGVEFDWDNNPEEGVTEDDTKYTVKLGYEW